MDWESVYFVPITRLIICMEHTDYLCESYILTIHMNYRDFHFVYFIQIINSYESYKFPFCIIHTD